MGLGGMMNRHVIDRVRTTRRLLASRWTAQVTEAPDGSPWWLDRARADRLMLAGIEALGDAMADGRVEPFAEFAARLSQEAFALQAPLHEVVRVILQLKPIVLEVLVGPAPAPQPDVAALELLDRLISAGILEAVRRYESQRQRRAMATQEQVEALRDRLRRQVIVDPLTGLYNANHFPIAVRREVRRSRRFGRVFTVALVCLNQDDEIREAGGDEGLRGVVLQLSEILTRATRQVDVRAALGGTRFGLILPETPPDGAVAVAERIRRAIESASFEFPEHPHHMTHTVSIGLACFPQEAQDDAGLLARLEEALTRARAGRSATVAALPTQHS
jgi:diguanylate cyclase (GGDEF)-like protein